MFYSKYFRCVNAFYVNYGQDIQISAQIMTNTVYIKQEPMKFSYGFRMKLMVFMVLNNCFRKNFMNFLRFVFISSAFGSSITWCSQSKTHSVSKNIKELRHFLRCHLMSVSTLKIFFSENVDEFLNFANTISYSPQLWT